MDIDQFTPKQKAVILEMCKGKANKEIARTLNIAEATVKLHLTEIFKTMGVSNRARAIIKASDFPITIKEQIPLTDLDILKQFTETVFKTIDNTWHDRVIEFGHAIQTNIKERNT